MSTLGSMLAAAVLAAPTTTLAAPMIGVSTNGNHVYDTYADLWTNVTDSGVATDIQIGGIVAPGSQGYVTKLRTQTVVGTMSNSNLGSIVTPLGLNSTFEISKIARYQQLVDAQSANNIHFTLPGAQDAAMDVDPFHSGIQNVVIYFDRLTPGGSSKATPGNGANTVRCYGTGSTSAGCGGAGDPDGDGTLIMSGHLIFNEASFTFSSIPGVGTGSFSTSFMIDYVNADYLDVVSGSIINDNFTGTTILPSFFNPVRAWDGTTPTTVPFFKVDSSQSFAATVPEPSTVALFGLGLAGLALSHRRKVGLGAGAGAVAAA
ncbi:PEP-CTERM sorting domain-containing protein [Rugamonas sp. CCM 8940]|nr:PEP-CTERM sorting domain-containing protein [Rugamonas sp. CCM 8940]